MLRPIILAVVSDRTTLFGATSSSASLGASYVAKGQLQLAAVVPQSYADWAALMGILSGAATVVYMVSKTFILWRANRKNQIKQALD